MSYEFLNYANTFSNPILDNQRYEMYAKILKEANEAAEKMYANMFTDSTAIFSAEASNGIQANSTSTIQTNTGFSCWTIEFFSINIHD